MSTMRLGVIVSVILHGVVLSLGYIALPSLRKDISVPDPDILEVELVTIDDVNRVPDELVKQAPEAKPQPAPEPKPEPKPKPVKVAEAPPPPPDAAPPPEKKPAVKKPKKVVKPIARPRAKPKPRKKFDDQKIAALIDKSLKAQEETQEAKQKKLAAAVANAQVVSLEAKRLTANLASVVRAQVHKCWALDPGIKGLDEMRVRIEVSLNQDGTIRGFPAIDKSDKQRMDAPGEGPYRAFAESARRAILRCAPYELPREMYANWQKLALNFDPQETVN